MSDEFQHYGIMRKSGRYPWGSGENEYKRSMDFYAYIDKIREKNPGIADKDIAKLIGEATPDKGSFSVANLRDTTTIAKEQKILHETMEAKKLKAKDWSVQAIAENLGISVGTVNLRLKASEEAKQSSLRNIAEVLRKNVDEHDIVDIGKGVQHSMGISPERLRAAASVLRDEGYMTHTVPVKQPGTNNFTQQLVMVKPGVTFGEARRMTDKIHTMGEWTEDNGKTFFGIHPPLSVSPKRIDVKYLEDGGGDRDGLIYVRPDVPDLSMGKNSYAQVRIKVGDTHYIKGVAVKNAKDIPAGKDIVVFSNKKRGTPVLGEGSNSVLKTLKDDKDNPFGSVISRQIVDIDPKTGKERVTSALNLLREEGDWQDWRNSIPSQVLSKQPRSLIKSQLETTRDQVNDRLTEIGKITNPVIRAKKYADFADQIDADAVDLRAAAMPHQRTAVILPVPKLNPTEVYAPQFPTGTPVVLIRFPHGGQFEIPEVTVNNNNRSAKAMLGNAIDAIGVHPKTAEKLSGADFDGDTVLVIPNPQGKVKGSESMGSAARVYERGLKDFNPKEQYGDYKVIGQRTKKDGTVEDIGNFKLMKNTGLEMGMITNLITDMQIQGATPDHVVRAVKHSMVVIDAEKHKLNYRQSAIDNGINQLRQLYQTTVLPNGETKVGGASTLLSKATAEVRVPQRKLRGAKQGGPINKETGELIYVPTGKQTSKFDKKTNTYLDEKTPVQESVKRLALTNDAFTLVRDKADPVEKLYAEHANEMKAIANSARLLSDRTPRPKMDPRAKKEYAPEIKKLYDDLAAAESQKPLDRRARVYAGITVKQKMDEDPLLRFDRERKLKVERQAVKAARSRLGLKTPVIEITDRQWDAIQARGVSASKLRAILAYADEKRITELSMPRQNTVVTTAIASRVRSLLAAGMTNADIAASLGIPASTIRGAIARGDI